jgi:hypothetical protein
MGGDHGSGSGPVPDAVRPWRAARYDAGMARRPVSRSGPEEPAGGRDRDERIAVPDAGGASDRVDRWGRDSFPASDPPSAWAGPDDVGAGRTRSP